MITALKSALRPIKNRALNIVSAHADDKANTSFVSFQTVLPNILKKYKPDFIFEFGPGFSTEVFLKESDAKIISYEKNQKWFQNYKKTYSLEDRVEILLQKNEKDFLNKLDEQKKTLVFVDGGNRSEIIYYTSQLKNSICVVHDAHREDYYWAINHFNNLIVLEPHCVLCWNNNDLSNLFIDIPTNASITSKYIKSDYRQAYQKTLMTKDAKTRKKKGEMSL